MPFVARTRWLYVHFCYERYRKLLMYTCVCFNDTKNRAKFLGLTCTLLFVLCLAGNCLPPLEPFCIMPIQHTLWVVRYPNGDARIRAPPQRKYRRIRVILPCQQRFGFYPSRAIFLYNFIRPRINKYFVCFTVICPNKILKFFFRKVPILCNLRHYITSKSRPMSLINQDIKIIFIPRHWSSLHPAYKTPGC